jgi:hypothetical protein
LGEGSNAEDAEGEMLDGIMTCTSKPIYELPSQEELLSQTVVWDDVVGDEFGKGKQEEMPEKPTLCPGWGNVQLKPSNSWFLKKHQEDWKTFDEENRQTIGCMIVRFDHSKIEIQSESEEEG